MNTLKSDIWSSDMVHRATRTKLILFCMQHSCLLASTSLTSVILNKFSI